MARPLLPQGALAEWRQHGPLAAACAAGMALAAMLTASFGVMLGPMEEELGWTRAQISSGPAIVSFMGLFLAPPAGYLIDRLGARFTGLIVVAISFIAIAGMSLIGTSIWHWWICWAIFGIAGAFTSTVWMAPVSSAFSAGRGMAIALTISGTGVSAALVPPVAEFFVQNYGWRTGFLGLSIIWCGVTLPMVLAFVPKMKFEDPDQPPKVPGEPAQASKAAPMGMTPREGFRSRNFYLLFFASLLSALTGVAIVLNLVPVLVDTDLSRADAIMIAGMMGVASVIGRIVGGWLMDIYDVKWLAIIASVVSVFFPIMLLIAPGNVTAAIVGIIAYGLTGGMKMNAIVYLVTTHLGSRSFGLFYGTISITTTVAMGIGPLIANHIYDQMQTYTPVIWAAIPGFLLAGLMFLLLTPAPDFAEKQ